MKNQQVEELSEAASKIEDQEDETSIIPRAGAESCGSSRSD
jgi:hypothetical protein